VALSNEALNIATRRREALEIEREVQARREETAALERRASDAEAAAAEAERFASDVRREAALIREEAIQLREEKERITSETATLRSEKESLEQNMLALRQEKSGIEVDAQRIVDERDRLAAESQRLAREKAAVEAEASSLRAEKQSLEQRQQAREAGATAECAGGDTAAARLGEALSGLAGAEQSPRGWTIALNDGQFEADAEELSPATQTLLAKLCGILLVLRELDVVVAGDAGTSVNADLDIELAERRASAVRTFMQQQNLEPERVTSRESVNEPPVTENDTDDGRRGVEILIVERDLDATAE
jgi:outer membrane protein OmpA-like peptidoglycan-associated protein